MMESSPVKVLTALNLVELLWYPVNDKHTSERVGYLCRMLEISYRLLYNSCSDFVADIDECKEKLACQCPECKCKNTWGSYECRCSSGLFYMQENDMCIGEAFLVLISLSVPF